MRVFFQIHRNFFGNQEKKNVEIFGKYVECKIKVNYISKKNVVEVIQQTFYRMYNISSYVRQTLLNHLIFIMRFRVSERDRM